MKKELTRKIDNRKKVQKTFKKTRHISLIRLSLLIIIIILILLGLYFVAKNSVLAIGNMSSSAIEKVKNIREEKNIENLEKTETIKMENKQVTQKDVLESLAKIMNMPEEELLRFVKITDSEGLVKQSPVFKGVKKDDWIIIYPSVMIVYDQQNNKLVKTIALK